MNLHRIGHCCILLDIQEKNFIIKLLTLIFAFAVFSRSLCVVNGFRSDYIGVIPLPLIRGIDPTLIPLNAPPI